jgi:iron complex outermembrane receptor protein
LRTADAGRLRGTRINAGIAYDGADTPESGDKPPLSMLHNWGARAGFTSLTANGRVLLHGGVSRRVRFPALRELYSGALGRFEPNPDLVPEKLVAAEAGSTWRLGRGEVQAVAFYHVLSDAIVRTSVAGGRFKRVNRDRQSATGAELLATVGIEAVSLGAELTIQDTWLSDDRGVASEPEYQPDVVAGVSAGASLPFGVRADARGKYIGRQMCVNAETNAQSVIASSRRVDAEAAKSWRMRGGWLSTLEASVAVDNISDATIYDQCGLPQPGRIMRLQVRLR